MTTQTRTIDQTQFQKFRDLAQILWQGGKYGYLWFKKGDDKKTYWVDAKHRDILLGDSSAQDDVYFGIYPTNAKKGDSERGKIEDIVALNCLFREYDLKDYTEGDKAALRMYVEALDPFPSVVIETAGGFHVYWLFDETVTVDQSKIDYYKDALHGWNEMDKFADPAAKDLARVLRVPGTFNQKPQYNEDERLTKVIGWHPERRYNGGDLLRRGLAERKVKQDLQNAMRATNKGVITPRKDINEKQLKRYVAEILTDVDKVAQAPDGQRTSMMFAVAVRLGEVVASGALAHVDARNMMVNACISNKLVQDDGLKAIEKQIENGINKGMNEGTPLDLSTFESYELTQRGLTVNDDIGETDDPRQNEAPPERNAVNSEMAFLGLILNNASAFQDITTRYNINAGHLANPRHQIIYSAIGAVALTGQPDLISVLDLLRRKKQLTNNGGKEYLEALCAADGNYASLPNYVKAIMDAYVARQMAGVQQGIGKINADPALGAEQKIAEMAKLIEQVQTPSGAAVIETGLEALSATYDWIMNAMEGEYGASTGFSQVDIYGELMPGELIELYARPGMGKTAFKINLMNNLIKQGHKVAFVSLELTKQQVMGRWAAMAKSIPNGHFPNLRDNDELKAFMHFMANFPNDLLFINDKKGLTTAEILNWMTRVHHEHGVKYFFGDHFGRVKYNTTNSGELSKEMGQFGLDLFEFAGNHQTTVLWAGQLNRACEARANKRPLLTDVGDSDRLTHHADRVWFLYRDSYYGLAEPGRDNHTELIIGKNRNFGDLGTAHLNFNRMYQQITDMSQHQMNINDEEILGDDIELIP